MKRSQVSITSEINSEKEYKIVKSSNINKDKLSENQKNKMLICSNLEREKLSLHKKYSEEL